MGCCCSSSSNLVKMNTRDISKYSYGEQVSIGPHSGTIVAIVPDLNANGSGYITIDTGVSAHDALQGLEGADTAALESSNPREKLLVI